MKCHECQFDNPPDSVFCRKCGTKFAFTDETMAETKSIVDQRPVPKQIIAGKYILIKELGRGGMGVVYKAEDVKLKRSVALKFLPQNLTQDSEARERFIHEAQAASQLDHSNICTVHEIDDDAGQMYIAMACYQGESLKEKIKRGPVNLAEAVDIALQTANGLTKAHEQGIVHRDVKPANILITKDGSVKIVDFGLAKLSDQTRITRSGTTMGTVAYMSPEQARGDVVDQRTDVWSLGAVLYEMLAGELPFKGEKETAVVYSILNEDPKPLHSVTPNIPYELEEIIKKALKKEPSDRFISAKEMSAALHTVQLEMTSGVTLDTARQRKRRSLKYMLAGAAAGVVIVIGVLLILSSIRPGLAFTERDKLLIVDVDNQTGEEVFDLALRTALEADLDQSPYVSIFDKGQVAETLRLMKVDPSSKIDETLGMDVCRFAGVRALILPRILSAGEAYELQAILVDPRRNRHVDRIRITARGREEVLLEAIDELARKVRAQLGESLPSIEKADKPVVQATTSSWEALNYLSMGQAKWHEGKFKEAATFFELALEKDPKFVSARGSLGLVQIQFLQQAEEGKEMLRQALADAKGLPQKEYLMIKAVNMQFVDEDLDAALDEYRLIREIFPDNMNAYNNSALILRSRGQFDEAAAMLERAAEIAPRNSLPLFNLWFTHLFWRKDSLSAEIAAQRMITLGPEIANHHHCRGYALVAQGRFEEAISAYRKALSIEPRHTYALPNLAHLLLATGRAVEAVPVYEEVRELVQQNRIPGYYPSSCFDLAMALREAGDDEQTKKVVAQGEEDLLKKTKKMPEQVWIFLSRAGMKAVEGDTNQAKDFLARALKLGVKDSREHVSLGGIYALLGEKDKAIETLKKGLELGYYDPYFPLILPAYHSVRNDPRFLDLFK